MVKKIFFTYKKLTNNKRIYIAYELDNWSNDLGNDFTVKTFWSETVKSTRKVPKEKFICNVYANSM